MSADKKRAARQAPSDPIQNDQASTYEDNAGCAPPHDESAQFVFSKVSHAADNQPQRCERPWSDFAAAVHNPLLRELKDGPAWLPATYRDGGKRRNVDVVSLTAWGLDLDSGGFSQEMIAKALNGYTYAAHTTYSSKPGVERWRIVLPLARPVAPTKARAIFAFFNDKFGGILDPACKDPARLFFLPACPAAQREHYQAFTREGARFDASDLPDSEVATATADFDHAPTIPQRVLEIATSDRRLRQHLDADPKVAKRKADGRVDRSALDWSLTMLLGRRGCFDDEIAATLRHYGHGKAGEKGESYTRDLLAKMRAELGPRSIGDQAAPHVVSAAALQGMELPPIRWIIPKMLPEGLGILAGRPKQGKSRIAMNVGLALAQGGRVLGREKVEQCSVLMLALEDSDRRLQHRMKELMSEGTWPECLHFATDWPRGDVAYLERHLDAHPDTGLVVIDTLGKWKPPPLKGSSAYDYNEDVAILSGLKKLADARAVAIMLVHHTRKADASHVIDEISGTAGIAGTADTLWVLKRAQGERDGVLHMQGREVEEEAYAIEWDHVLFSWKLVGLASQVHISSEQKELLDVIKRHKEGIRPSELARALGRESSGVAHLLKKLADSGMVEKIEGLWRPSEI